MQFRSQKSSQSLGNERRIHMEARFNGIGVIQADGISSINYRVTASYKTALVWKDGINICTIYPWKGMTDDEFISTFGDEFPTLSADQLHRIAEFVRTHVVAE